MVNKSAASPRSRTLGPVSDLERHLPRDWWKTLFNALYLKTDGDVVENDQNTAIEIDMLIRTIGLEPNDRILDLCCGQARHSLELARRGFRRIVGLDRSRHLIRLARRRAKVARLDVTLHEGDARRFRLPENSFDCAILMGNSFGYFEREADDIKVLETVKRTLRSAGTLVMDLADGDWLRDNFEPRTWEWIDQNHFVCRERSLAADSERLITREVVVHSERGVIADQFYAERLYTRDRIRALIETAGFTAIRFHDPVDTLSSRGQDLGMMARRNFISAQAPVKTMRSRRGRVPFPEVTVLLGDPRLPDTVKMDGVFNSEDFDTIQKFKDACAELSSYRFCYLDNHASMLADLRGNPPQFVLNLCDEGFQNDAFKELHIPALLEMLSIPYSGAGPSGLGLCYDKGIVRSVAEALDVPVPLETFFHPDDQAATIPSVFPALVKPATGDSSIGITKEAVVCSPDELVAYVAWIRDTLPGRLILVQEFLTGAEYSVGLIGNPGFGYTALPVLQVDYSNLNPALPKILSYESKWDPASPYWTQIGYLESTLEVEERRRMIDISTLLFERTGCRDYARFDFRADSNGEVKLLEVNPNPGWCWDGKLNLMAGFAGYRYADLIRMILEAAQARTAVQQGQREVQGLSTVALAEARTGT